MDSILFESNSMDTEYGWIEFVVIALECYRGEDIYTNNI